MASILTPSSPPGETAPASPAARAPRIPGVVVSTIFGVALMLLVGNLAGQDYNWDLLNYHYASPQLLLSGRYDVDVAPSGMQSWFNPIGYVPAYAAITYLPPRIAAALFAIVGGLNAPLIYLIAARIDPNRANGATVISRFVCVAIGMSGALMFSEAGTTFLDTILSIPILGAVLAMTTALTAADPGRRNLRIVTAGLLIGAACGLKLTNVVMAVGMTGALTLFVATRRTPAVAAIAFALGGLMGFALTGGWWAWRMWAAFGNPVFPMLNGLFRSPFAAARSVIDTTFLPRDWTALFAYPWHWLVGDTMPGTEIAIRDPRYAVAVVASVVLVGAVPVLRRRTDGADARLLVAAFCACSYVAWLFSFAILRYLVVLEMMSGIVLLAALSLLPQRFARRAPTILIFAALAITVGTRHAGWGRVPFSQDWFGVRGVERVHRPGTLYVLPSDMPLGFLIHLFPPDARFMRIGGTFPLAPGTVLRARATRMIGDAPHLRSLIVNPDDPEAAATLAGFGLVTLPGRCAAIATKRAAVESCPLGRIR